jgi:hypothetical protein
MLVLCNGAASATAQRSSESSAQPVATTTNRAPSVWVRDANAIAVTAVVAVCMCLALWLFLFFRARCGQRIRAPSEDRHASLIQGVEMGRGIDRESEYTNVPLTGDERDCTSSDQHPEACRDSVCRDLAARHAHSHSTSDSPSSSLSEC